MKNKEINLTLEERLAALGIMVSARLLTKAERDSVDIEETLSEAFVAIGNDENYFRFLSPLFSWIEIHADSVIVEKLLKINKRLQKPSSNLSLFSLAACFAVKCGFRNWARLLIISEIESGGAIFGPRDLVESLLQLRGEEEWAKKCGVRLPKGVLTTNSKWVLSKEALARTNRQYRNRLIYGPQWRADIINALELGARTPAEASRISGASYEPCHRVLRELTAAGKIRASVPRRIRQDWGPQNKTQLSRLVDS